MRRLVWVALALTYLMLAAATSEQTEKRIALLIGNESYSAEIGRLSNPHNDVALLEKALKRLGFEVVVEQNASLGALTRTVNAYARRLQAAGPNAVGFFYYSGHGASDGTTNYLIPIDVKTSESGELWDESLRLTEVTRKLKSSHRPAVPAAGQPERRCQTDLPLTNCGAQTSRASSNSATDAIAILSQLQITLRGTCCCARLSSPPARTFPLRHSTASFASAAWSHRPRCRQVLELRCWRQTDTATSRP